MLTNCWTYCQNGEVVYFKGHRVSVRPITPRLEARPRTLMSQMNVMIRRGCLQRVGLPALRVRGEVLSDSLLPSLSTRQARRTQQSNVPFIYPSKTGAHY